MKTIDDLNTLLRMGEFMTFTKGDPQLKVEISNDLVIRLFTEFAQLRDEVDLLQQLLSSNGTLIPLYQGDNPMDTDQRWYEEPYANADARQAILDRIVTESWDNLDNISIIDSINYAEEEELIELASLLRDSESEDKIIVDKLHKIINSYFSYQAEESLE